MADRIIVNKHFDSGSSVSLSSFTANEALRKGEMVIVNDASAPAVYIVDTENKVVNVAAQQEIDITKVKVSGVTLDQYIALAVAAATSKISVVPHFLTQSERDVLLASGAVITSEGELVEYSDNGLYYVYEEGTKPTTGTTADFDSENNRLILERAELSESGVLTVTNAELNGTTLIFNVITPEGGDIEYDAETGEMIVSGDNVSLEGGILSLPSNMVTLENNTLIYSK